MLSLGAVEYWVDPVAGDDANSGMKGMPLKTLNAAGELVADGDIVFLMAGVHEKFKMHTRGGDHRHQDWVTFKPAPGIKDPLETVKVNRIGFTAASVKTDEGWVMKPYDLYFRFENLHIPDGIWVEYAAHLDFTQCKIEREGPWVGSGEAIAKAAVTLKGANHVTIRDCELTNAGHGVKMTGNHIQLLNNYIHTLTQDGIHGTNIRDLLIEGNHIHNLDDGVWDTDPAGKGWNKHCDGIHLFTSGSGGGTWVERVVIRGNRVYNVEAHNLIINNSVYNYTHKDILIENNIFGPAVAPCMNITAVHHLVIRNNMLIAIPGGATYQSRYREITGNNTSLRLPADPVDARVYNNYLPSTTTRSPKAWIDYNFYAGKRQPDVLLSRNEKLIEDPGLVDPGSFDGKLKPDSPLINAGTRIVGRELQIQKDFYGTARDARPDIGAVELPGQNPPPEILPEPRPVNPRRFVDDFLDGNLFADPWLNSTTQTGLSWKPLHANQPWQLLMRDEIPSLTVVNAKSTTVLTDGHAPWKNFSAKVEVLGLGPVQIGFLLRTNDIGEGYLIEGSEGIIYALREVDGEMLRKQLSGPGEPLPQLRGHKRYQAVIQDSARGVEIMLLDAQDNVLLKGIDPYRNFKEGGLGLLCLKQAGAQHTHRIHVFSVEVDIQP